MEEKVTEVTHERGVNAGLIKAWLEIKQGEGALDAIAARISPDARGMLTNPATNRWYPVALIREIYQAVHDEFAADDPRVLVDYGRFAADRSATGLLRYLMKLIDMDKIIKRMGTFWKHYHKGGKITAGELVEVDGRKKRVVTIHGYDATPPGCLIQEGYFESISVRAGARNVRIEKKECIHKGDEACSWEVSWE